MNEECDSNKIDNVNTFSTFLDYKQESNVRNSAFPNEYMYGYTYVPRQMLNETFKPEVGLRKGTIFPELVSEWSPENSAMDMTYLRNSQMRRDENYG